MMVNLSIQDTPKCTPWRNTTWSSKIAKGIEEQAQEAVRNSNYETALGLYDQLICIFPWEIGTWVTKANLLVKMGEFDNAERCFRAGIREYSLWDGPSKPPRKQLAAAYYYYAIMLITKSPPDQEAALALLNTAINLYPHEPEFYLFRAIVLWNLNQEGSLIETDFAKALKLASLPCKEPECERLIGVINQILRNRAIYFTKTGNYSAALADTEALLVSDPDNGEAYFFKGKILILMEEERLQSSIENLPEATECFIMAKDLGYKDPELDIYLQ